MAIVGQRTELTFVESSIPDLGTAVLDENFPDVDLALRRGRHIDRDDGPWYTFLVEAQDVLEPFYRRFGCELVRRTDGYFYLLPSGEKLGRRQLSTSEMVVGQGLALLYLDPQTMQTGGHIDRNTLLAHLAAILGSEGLATAMGHKSKRADERIAQQVVRRKVGGALRRLAQLGFIELANDERLRLRAALMRFAEPVRGVGSPEHALERLIAQGEVVLGEGEDDLTDPDDPESERDDEDDVGDPIDDPERRHPEEDSGDLERVAQDEESRDDPEPPHPEHSADPEAMARESVDVPDRQTTFENLDEIEDLDAFDP